MAIHRFWRKAKRKASRRRRAAPLLPESTGLSQTMGLSGTARRVNRVVAVVALFGAFGTVALAVALTPGGQTSASSAPALQEDFKISRIEVPPSPATPPAPVAASSLNTTVVVVQPPPEPAPKADRLYRTPQAPEDRNVQSTGEAVERDVAMADVPEPKAAREAAESAGRKLDDDDDDGRSLEFGLSEPPAPGEFRDAAAADATLDDIEDAIEDAIEAAVDEASDEAVEDTAIEDAAEAPIEEEVEEEVEEAMEPAPEPAAPEVAATRTAPVTTDVNMRARPENGAAVIQVVPGKSTVEVIGCDYWCEVVYEGKRGWIYKGFVRGS